MNNSVKPIGMVTTISFLLSTPKNLWNSVMTIENSPLRKLDPIVAHMVFQSLAFVWSGIFAAMMGSIIAFGISAAFHILLISGIVITATVFDQSSKNPQSINRMVKNGVKYNGRAETGEHE
jgi:hypothetical protein